MIDLLVGENNFWGLWIDQEGNFWWFNKSKKNSAYPYGYIDECTTFDYVIDKIAVNVKEGNWIWADGITREN